jgi:hypothetical protein
MAERQVSAEYAPAVDRAPLWPVLIAPLVAGLYYLALRQAFVLCLESVVADASDLAPQDGGAPQWGSHWLYRAFAEAVSVPFGIFIAAGIAQKRAKLAGLVAGLAISVVYLLKNLGLLYSMYRWPGYYELIEPWSQHVVDGLIIIGAPYAGYFLGEAMFETVAEKPSGFVGINRLHFVWLWLLVMAYASGVIAPLITILVGSIMSSGNGDLVRNIVLGVPVLAFAVPVMSGLAVLSHQTSWPRPVNNIVGPLILIIGWLLATGLVYLWGTLAGKIFHAVFG